MGTVCNVCDSTEFTVNAGFYYCDNCGQRITVLQEIEDQTNEFQGDDILLNKVTIKVVAKTENTELTSWETYNYILYGFVNELICLGCKNELMLTTLQLWSTYLRKNEVAFYSKRDTNLPKFSFKYKLRDVNLIYNLPKKRRRYISSASSGSGTHQSQLTFRQTKAELTKQKKNLANVQYEEYISSQKSDISSVGFNLSQASSTGPSSDNSDGTIRIKYSRRTRKRARQKMTKSHLNEHQNDICRKLKCHKLHDKDSVGRTFIYAILWLALNQIDDELQLGDLIRYAKETHIKYNNISSFLPANVKSTFAVNSFRKNSNDCQTHFALRSKAFSIAKTINIRNIKLPDLSKLCERYVKDLCLPPAVNEMVDQLIAFDPPKMNTKYNSMIIPAIPNFEGRAMAYILFILKLFFGLDDEREHKISKSAQVVNQKLDEFNSMTEKLFIWSEWVEYIDMRNVILSQCHYPTAIHINPNAKLPTDLYIDFLKRANEDSFSHDRYKQSEMENIRIVFDQIVQLHKKKNTENSSLHFQPTLTPFSNYMEQILSNESRKSDMNIPEFMNVGHESRDISAYLKPNKLKKVFRKNGFRLQTNEIGHNSKLDFSDINFSNSKITENVKFNFDITKQKWIESLQERQNKANELNRLRKNEFNDEMRKQTKKHLDNMKEKELNILKEKQSVNKIANANLSNVHSYEYYDEDEGHCHLNDNNIINEPRRNLDNQPNILDYYPSDDSDEMSDNEFDSNANKIELTVSNFDYWISMQNVYYLTNKTFEDKLSELPKSFQWLLNQCALQTHMHIKDLYIELLTIENQYRYVLKPTFKMNNCIKFRDINKLDGKTLNAVKLLQKFW